MAVRSTTPTLQALRLQRAEILRVAAAHDATNVRVFGSIARGDANAASDVDFLVDLVTKKRGFEYFGLLDDLRQALERAYWGVPSMWARMSRTTLADACTRLRCEG
jgi:uncharacterized protein